MTKKLTITVEDDVYDGLHAVIGRRRMSRFLNDLACPHVTQGELGGHIAPWRPTRNASARRRNGWRT
jgi:hypothetical protein